MRPPSPSRRLLDMELATRQGGWDLASSALGLSPSCVLCSLLWPWPWPFLPLPAPGVLPCLRPLLPPGGAALAHLPPPRGCDCAPAASVSSAHFSSVFCPCGKARLCAASCLTLLHLRPPGGPGDGGAEPVEPVEPVAALRCPDPGLRPRHLRFPAWGVLFSEGPCWWRARGAGKGGRCRARRPRLV